MFWNEVRKSTFLEASVLHRYFNHVRSMALEKIRDSYSSVDKLDLDFFKYRLFFDNDDDVSLFLASHNVYPNEEGLYIVREVKKDYSEPEDPIPILLSGHILSKVGDSVTPGDIIWGENRILQPWSVRNYKPTSAFANRTNQLMVTARDIVEEVEKRVKQSTEVDYETEILSAEVEELAEEVVESAVSEIAMATVISERRLCTRAQHGLEILFDS